MKWINSLGLNLINFLVMSIVFNQMYLNVNKISIFVSGLNWYAIMNNVNGMLFVAVVLFGYRAVKNIINVVERVRK